MSSGWTPAIKIAESPEKTPTPGSKQAWRIYDRRGLAIVDLLSRDDEDPRQLDQIAVRHPADYTKHRQLEQKGIATIEPLLIEVLRQGTQVYEPPPLAELRARRAADVDRLDAGVRRLINPHIYHVSLTEQLWELKQRVIAEAQRQSR